MRGLVHPRRRSRNRLAAHVLTVQLLLSLWAVSDISAQSKSSAPSSGPPPATEATTGGDAPQAPADTKPQTPPAAQPPEQAVPLNRKQTVLLDRAGKRLWLRTQVVLRDGILEMLVCKKQTKEHESILAIDAQAYLIHTGLLALGLEPGKPVQFVPEFRAPQGPIIDIYVTWIDQQGKRQRASAHDWIRTSTRRYYVHKLPQLPAGLTLPDDGDLRYDSKLQELYWYGTMTAEERDDLLQRSTDPTYQKIVKTIYHESQPRQMQADWVFAGSGFFVDEQTGERYYQAESGDVICVANFSSATLDVAMRSTATGENALLFEANPDAVPPLGTPVLVELLPRKLHPSETPADAAPAEKPRRADRP